MFKKDTGIGTFEAYVKHRLSLAKRTHRQESFNQLHHLVVVLFYYCFNGLN